MEKESEKRIFIGILPPENVIRSLAETICIYKNEVWSKEVKWVPDNNLHLTLKFIGVISEKRLKTLVSATEKALSEFKAFSIKISGLKIFPKPSRPSVICAGAGDTGQRLSELVSSIEDELYNEKFQKERRRFKGHITLGRCRKNFQRGLHIENHIKQTDFNVDDVIIFSSILKPKGAVYRVEKRIPLIPRAL